MKNYLPMTFLNLKLYIITTNILFALNLLGLQSNFTKTNYVRLFQNYEISIVQLLKLCPSPNQVAR